MGSVYRDGVARMAQVAGCWGNGGNKHKQRTRKASNKWALQPSSLWGIESKKKAMLEMKPSLLLPYARDGEQLMFAGLPRTVTQSVWPGNILKQWHFISRLHPHRTMPMGEVPVTWLGHSAGRAAQGPETGAYQRLHCGPGQWRERPSQLPSRSPEPCGCPVLRDPGWAHQTAPLEANSACVLRLVVQDLVWF